MNYRTATWPTGRTGEIRFAKWGSLKAMRQWLISEAVINPEDWDRLVGGEEIARADFPDRMIALAHTRDRYFPCFYYGKQYKGPGNAPGPALPGRAKGCRGEGNA